MAASRHCGQVRASVAVGMDTAAVGQPPLVSTVSWSPRSSTISCNAGNHCAAWESPNSTTRTGASGLP